MAYAGFWRRGVAMFIDSVIISLGGLVVIVPLQAVLGLSNLEGATPEEMRAGMARMMLVLFIWLGLWIVYFAAFESSARQATPGKMALGVVVTDDAGQRIGFGRAAARTAAKYVSAMILWIGFLMAAFTARKQALHDMMTGCLVLRR